ncbi:transglutaminase family protein [Aliishimia ponticola]|uniref:Transglutaminase family protein n=1 Tax=Aliishimia ponticola TaxID=2499833 RepID=A0A4S4NBD6_9RHOB|nr:transglutaminase family protein [Aliishimia ponticola]THH35291.1 transglutaminase family protein [Aliishimia ponticola]
MLTVPDRHGPGVLLAPRGMATPNGTTAGLAVTGGTVRQVEETTCGQTAAAIETNGGAVELRYEVAPTAAPYPDAMFQTRDSRFTRAAQALIDDATALAAAPDPAHAVAQHVASLFSYGHPDTRYYDDQDTLPQLCSLTVGSCVDINAYFIASLRAAGVDAGYVTGYFFPAEKTDPDGAAWCNDMHCWVVTRDAQGIREWDIAHHMKAGLDTIAPALNPKPGRRFAVAHSMGLSFPELALSDIKLIAEPMWVSQGRLTDAEVSIRFAP